MFKGKLWLNLIVFLVAFSGLGYELLLGALGAYLFGDYLLIYSITIGTFMFSLGLGALLSRRISDERKGFVIAEVILIVSGALTSWFLYRAYGVLGDVSFILFIAYSVLLGALVGVELPLLIRLMKGDEGLREVLAESFFWDYIGGLAVSVTFPTLLITLLGFVGTSVALATINLLALSLFIRIARWRRVNLLLIVLALLLGLISVLTIASSEELIEGVLEQDVYNAIVLTIKQTPYQRLALVYRRDLGIALFIDGNLQFTQLDEYRYHEALIHPAVAVHPSEPHEVLVLGGGDGLALRELERYSFIKHITLVDIDEEMIELAERYLAELNRNSFRDPRVEVVIRDAEDYLEEASSEGRKYDLIVVDLPDPHNLTLSKLYTTRFFKLIGEVMREDAVGVIQSTSPFETRYAFWCINATLRAVGFHVIPYRVEVPTFGVWGYNLFSKRELDIRLAKRIDEVPGLRFMTYELFRASLNFPRDEAKVEVKVNTELNPVIYTYYQRVRKPGG